MVKFKIEKLIDVSDWDDFVSQTYKRPYCFQQQYGCQPRGIFRFTVPSDADDFENETVPEVVNHEERGVSFSAWLSRNPETPVGNREDDHSLDLWWSRNFYPDFQTVANDLHNRGLLDAGEYTIEIDW